MTVHYNDFIIEQWLCLLGSFYEVTWN